MLPIADGRHLVDRVPDAAQPAAAPVQQYCAAAPPTSPAAYQASFDGLGHSTDWLSADTAVPVPLPDGRTVWLFGDTYVGALAADGSIAPNTRFVHNSLVVQDGPCLTPLMGGRPGARTGIIPSPSTGGEYWPMSGAIEDGVLRVFLCHVTPTGPGPLDFEVIDVQVATFSLPGLQLQAVQPLPFPTSGAQPYGSTELTARDGYVYLYGETDRNVYVARAPLGQILTAGAWQFWGGSAATPGWTASGAARCPCNGTTCPPFPRLGRGRGPKAEPSVQPYGSGYLATAKLANDVSSDISVFTAPDPQGPWTYYGEVATTPGPPLIAYGAWEATLAGTSSPTVAYSTNLLAATPSDPLSGQTYGPHFQAPIPGSMPPP